MRLWLFWFSHTFSFDLEISAAVSTQIDGNIAIRPYILTTLVWKTLHDLYCLFLITTNIEVEPKCQRIICNAYWSWHATMDFQCCWQTQFDRFAGLLTTHAWGKAQPMRYRWPLKWNTLQDICPFSHHKLCLPNKTLDANAWKFYSVPNTQIQFRPCYRPFLDQSHQEE